MSTSYIDLPAFGDPHWRAPVVLTSDLPILGNQVGDVILAEDTNTIYVWNGSSWLAVATPGAAIAIDGLIGDVSATGPGVVVATVNSVGGQSAANIATATTLVTGNKTANTVLAGPTSGAAAPATFRALVGADFTGSFTTGSVIFAGSTGGLSQDNSKFFWDDTNLALGIGTIPATTAVLDIVNNSGTTKAIQTTGYGSNVGFRARRANGTLASPTASTSGDILSFFSGRGYGDTAFAAAATGAISVIADGVGLFTDASMPTYLTFQVTPTGSVTVAEAMRVNSTGNILIGTTSDLANAQIQSLSATQAQLALRYDSTNFSLFQATSINGLNINPTTNPATTGGAVVISGAVAASLDGAAGGGATLKGSNGSSISTGGTGGPLTLTAGSAGGDGTVNRPAGGVTITSGNSLGTAAGGAVNITSGVGGAGTGTAGSTGGAFTVNGGIGGAGSATSGSGGVASLIGGAGGAGVAGGAGGGVILRGGIGGAGSSTGGVGGSATVQGGAAAAVTGSTGGGVTILAANGGAVAASAGGAISVTGGTGSSTGSGGPGGALTITGGSAGGDNTVNRAGGGVTLTAGNSKGDSAGAQLFGSGGVGGAGTGTAGATGGAASWTGGVGGIGSATSGNGGQAALTGGTGGAGTAGGNGGNIQISGGTAGAGSSTGGNGGTITIVGGTAAAVAGSAGGAASVSGAAGTATGTGGAAGGLTLNGGSAGGDNTVNRAGGVVTITAGAAKGDSVGAAATLKSGAGGLGTGSTGANGGVTTVSAGAGGVGSATGGVGGAVQLTGGLGGNSGAPGAGGAIIFSTAATTSAVVRGTVTAAGLWGIGNNASPTYLVDVLGGSVGVATIGQGFRTKEGTNAKQGVATLAAGTVVVSNSSVTASSRIFLTSNTDGGTPGFVRVSARSAGSSFTITSSSNTDTSIIAWEIFEPY